MAEAMVYIMSMKVNYMLFEFVQTEKPELKQHLDYLFVYQKVFQEEKLVLLKIIHRIFQQHLP